jgi:endonuclease-3
MVTPPDVSGVVPDFAYPRAVSRIGPVTRARAAEVARLLEAAYPGKPVPSLHFRNPYECVVAVSLSAQTTDENVNKVLPKLFARWPDAQTLAQANQKDLEECVHSLGFYRNKARNLLGMARLVVDEYAGKIPGDMDALLRLPGVARKTANIVLSESFGLVRGIAVDTHVFRLSHRLGLSQAKTPAATEGDLCKAFAYEHWYRVNFELITHGRRVCTAAAPRCEACVLEPLCPRRGVRT